MRILVIADEESKALWDYYDRSKLEGVDLIISCGDLHSDYLQFLVTMSGVPLVYVRGNHDRGYDRKPPLGCIDIDDTIYNFEGVRILGFGGSMRYGNGKDMYTEAEMKARIRKLRRKLTMTKGIDILVTHAPAKGYGDMEDLPHRGFECFNDFLNHYKPKYMLHGHVHSNYGAFFKRERDHECGTKIINCFGTYMLEIGEDEHPEKGKTGARLYDLSVRVADRRRKKYHH